MNKENGQNKKTQKTIEQPREEFPATQKCTRCPNPLFKTLESADAEPYKIGEEPVCRDCYFKELGEEIEKHPIGNPKILKNFNK